MGSVSIQDIEEMLRAEGYNVDDLPSGIIEEAEAVWEDECKEMLDHEIEQNKQNILSAYAAHLGLKKMS